MLCWSSGGISAGVSPYDTLNQKTWREKLSQDLAKLYAKLYVARRDVKAIQLTSGAYNPTVDRDPTGNVTRMHPWTMQDFLDHIEGRRTYGHYLLSLENQCKFFAFDIDLDELNPEKVNDKLQVPTSVDSDGVWGDFVLCDPRAVWLDRRQSIPRAFLKYQMRCIANHLAKTIAAEFDIPTAVAYTGAKGIHVYGFTGLLPAKDVREGAELVLKKTDRFQPHLGSNFFKYKDSGDHEYSNQCFTVEVFPKQTELKEGGYGNLMRLPLGVNLKNPSDPTFFVDLRAPLSQLQPRDAVDTLTTLNQWL